MSQSSASLGELRAARNRALTQSLSHSQKQRPTANQNTTQGTQMAARTAAAIVIWDVPREAQ